jgi:hypothetical protein
MVGRLKSGDPIQGVQQQGLMKIQVGRRTQDRGKAGLPLA